MEGIEAKRRIIIAIKIKPGALDLAKKFGIELWHAKTEKPKKYKKQ